jgi:hypothetical protein
MINQGCLISMGLAGSMASAGLAPLLTWLVHPAGRRASRVQAAGHFPLSAGNCRIGCGGGYLNFAAAFSNDS